MWSRRVGAAAVAVAIGACLAGCAGPRIVRGITSRGDEVKFLYYQGADTGVIKCKMNPDGALADCKPMAVELEP